MQTVEDKSKSGLSILAEVLDSLDWTLAKDASVPVELVEVEHPADKPVTLIGLEKYTCMAVCLHCLIGNVEADKNGFTQGRITLGFSRNSRGFWWTPMCKCWGSKFRNRDQKWGPSTECKYSFEQNLSTKRYLFPTFDDLKTIGAMVRNSQCVIEKAPHGFVLNIFPFGFLQNNTGLELKRIAERALSIKMTYDDTKREETLFLLRMLSQERLEEVKRIIGMCAKVKHFGMKAKSDTNPHKLTKVKKEKV